MIAALVLGAGANAGLAQDALGVMTGGEAGFDACASLGQVVVPEGPQGAQAAVRAGPAASYAARDALETGALVWLCDERGDWVGIVYGEDPAACGVSTPQAERRAYEGPCASGWIHRSVVQPAAG
jgi:hypothetical protein